MDVVIDQKSGAIGDPYILFERDIVLRPGESSVDAARRIPRPSIHRVYEILASEAEQIRRKRIPGIILCPGAAVGINKDNHIGHFWPGRGLDFLGFLVALGDNREAAVQVRGSVVIKLPGAKPHAKVYCSGPDSFSLIPTPGSAEIGAIRFVQNDRASVFFKRAGDPRPLNLDVSTV